MSTRLTRTGGGALGGGLVLYAVGVVLGYPEIVVLGAALLLLLVAAAGWLLPRPRLEVSRVVEPRRVPRGDAALGLVRVVNAGSRGSAGFRAVDHVGTRSVGVDVPALVAGAAHTATYRLPTHQRGVFDVGPLVLVQSDPFGLLRRDRGQGSSERLWVHPRHHPMTSPVGLARDLEGPTADTALEGSITFHALREYVVGDDLRQVHWRTTARTGTLMVRQHVDTSRPETLLLLDDRRARYADDESFEQAIEATASVLVATAGAGFPVRLELVSRRPVGLPGAEVVPLLDALSELAPALDDDVPLAPAIVGNDRGGSAAVFTGGRVTGDEISVLSGLRGRFHRVISLLVTDQPIGSARVRGIDVIEDRGVAGLVVGWNATVGR